MSTDGFTHVPFSALAEVNPPRGALKLSLDSEVSFIPMGDVTESGRWVGRQTRRFVEVRNGFTNFAEGDVLMAKITPCMENGKGCLARGLVNGVGFGSTEFHVLRAKPESDSGYIHQWSLHAALRKQAKNSMTGSAGQQRVPSGFFDQFRIPAFPQPEQAKIAEVLGAVDRAIEETEALVAKQQRLKAGLMQDLLTRGIDAHGQLRAESTHAFKDSPLGRIPVEWEAVQVGEIVAGIDAGWSPSCEDVTPSQGEWGVLKVSAVSSGVFNPAESKRLPALLRPIESLEVRKGDVLISRANGVAELVGRCVFVHHTPSKLMLSDKTLRLIPKREKIEPFMLAALLATESVRRQIMNCISGSSGQKNLSQKQICSFVAPLPHIQEQASIRSAIFSTAKQLESSTMTLAKLRSLKTALMQDLLTGRRRVTVLLPA